jgi:hypothetical protein
MKTRWESDFSDPQWLMLDMGGEISFTTVELYWETAYGESYDIDISDDGESWTTVYSEKNGDGGLDEINLTGYSGRYIRMFGHVRGGRYGYSLYEFKVSSSDPTPSAASPTPSPVSAPAADPTPAPVADPPKPPTNNSGLWRPKSTDKLTWQWQLQGTIDTSFNVDMYDIDLFDTSASTIKKLKDAGRTVVCYFSAGTYEGWREDWQQKFDFINGDTYNGNQAPFAGKMDDWDERWLDIRRIDLLEPIMRGRLELAVSKGCDAVEPDNVDAYTIQRRRNWCEFEV